MRRAWTSRPATAVWALLALALLVRVAVIVATPGYEPGADAADFDRHAASIARGNGYPPSSLVAREGPTAFRPPGYPLALAAAYKAPGPSWTDGRLLQALLGTLVVGLVGLLAMRLWGRRAALVAMALGAVFPPLLVIGAGLLSEPLFLVFELAALIAVVEHRRSPHTHRWALAAGILAGLATLTRVNGVLLAVPLALAVWTLRPRLSAAAVARPAVLIAAMALTMAPWAARNAAELDAFIPLSTQGDFALARNYNEVARSDPDLPGTPHTAPRHLAIVEDPRLDEAEAADELGSDAREFMRDHPGYVAETVARNIAGTAHLALVDQARSAGEEVGIERWLVDLGIYSLYPFALLALAGALVAARRRDLPWFAWLTPLVALAPALLIAAGRARYRAPIDPLIVLLAALALVAARDRLSRDWLRRSRGTAPPG